MVIGACAAPRFQDMRSPSGDFCSDMPIFPAGKIPEREYHRLGPIQSAPDVRTEAERMESLRKAACAAGGDAIIEAVNEEQKQPNATYATISSGTAVTWTRRTGGETAKPIPILEMNTTATVGNEHGMTSPPPPESATPASSAAPAASATPTAAPTASSSAKPNPSVVPFGKKPGGQK